MEANLSEKQCDFWENVNWFWTKVGLNLDKHWDLTRSELLICYVIIPYANVIKGTICFLGGLLVLVWKRFWEKVGLVLDQNREVLAK